jgi:NAD(P)-dependent dehydrogenase (short-subunit alcohol dehydrogenase family)
MAPNHSSNPLDLSGRTILLTGASSGIGRETALLLAQLGARLILVARNTERLEAVRGALSGEGHVAESFDLAEAPASIPDWMKRLAATTGPIAGAVHSAGVHVTAPLMAVKPQDFEKAYGLNVVVGAMLVKGLRQKSVRTPQSSAVLVSSVSGLAGTAGVSAYSASKGALTALARSLAVELAPEKIRVNCVAPGFVQTEMSEKFGQLLTPEQLARIAGLHPLGLGTPRDVACAIAFLLSDAARWITGTTLVVDGGYTAQ